MQAISTLGRLISRVEEGLLALLLGLMIIIATSQIFMRHPWETGMEWNDPLARLLMLWLGLLGAMAATRDEGHIKFDPVSKQLPPFLSRHAAPLASVASALICLAVCYHAVRFVMMEYEAGTTAFATVPIWICAIIIPTGFGLMALRFIVSAICKFHGKRHLAQMS